MVKEFKEFISKGNVVDLAVGVIIGGAFGKIVASLVNDILMPIVGVLIGGHDFTSFSFKFESAVISYGMFIQNIIDFLIVAFCIFIFVKGFNKLTKKTKPEETKPKKDENTILLEQIRDLLKEKKGK